MFSHSLNKSKFFFSLKDYYRHSFAFSLQKGLTCVKDLI